MRVTHICIFDRECWKDTFDFGMPMRVYYETRKGQKWVTIPTGSGRRTKRIFDLDDSIGCYYEECVEPYRDGSPHVHKSHVERRKDDS